MGSFSWYRVILVGHRCYSKAKRNSPRDSCSQKTLCFNFALLNTKCSKFEPFLAGMDGPVRADSYFTNSTFNVSLRGMARFYHLGELY